MPDTSAAQVQNCPALSLSQIAYLDSHADPAALARAGVNIHHHVDRGLAVDTPVLDVDAAKCHGPQLHWHMSWSGLLKDGLCDQGCLHVRSVWRRIQELDHHDNAGQ